MAAKMGMEASPAAAPGAFMVAAHLATAVLAVVVAARELTMGNSIMAVLLAGTVVAAVAYNFVARFAATTDFPLVREMAKQALVPAGVPTSAAAALKFTDQGHVELCVDCGPVFGGHAALTFHVRDTGIGIPEHKQRDIFEAFAQADGSVTRRHGGTGLGLSISAQLVELMRGRIELISAPGKGSDFFFTLHLPCKAAAAEMAAGAPETDPGRPLRILVAEDNTINQIVVTRLLTRHGHDVQLVSNGREAVAAVETGEYDIVLMDNQMPELGGIEATKILRSRSYSLPIVGISANALLGDRQRFLDAGMDGYVAKPFHAEELYTEIKRCLQRSGMPLQ